VLWGRGISFANDGKGGRGANETVDGEYQNYKAKAARTPASISSASRLS
jgi:hypothetical protein